MATLLDVVNVTLAHPLDAAASASLGVPPGEHVVGEVLAVTPESAKRLYLAGLIVRNVSLDDLLTGGGATTVDPSTTTYVSPTAPVVEPGKPYIWFQTGGGSDGSGVTIWVEDGTP